METENAVAKYDMTQTAMTAQSMVKQVALIQDIMKNIMKKDEHFGIIPGCEKPSLLKPGAEKLSLTFRLAPSYEVIQIDFEGGHRECRVICTLTHIPTGQIFGQGVGSCTTLEGKYRFRGGEKEGTGRPVPKEYWNLKAAGKLDDAKKLIGGKGFGVGKIDGKWEVCSIGEKLEHDNPADYYNTILKIAKKRAHVDAVLTATGASDIFTQDVEDMPEVIPGAAKNQGGAGKNGEDKNLKEPKSRSGQKEEKQPEQGNLDEPATDPQIEAINKMIGRLGIKDDFERHRKASRLAEITGDEVITSMKALTRGQASKVIKALGAELDAQKAA